MECNGEVKSELIAAELSGPQDDVLADAAVAEGGGFVALAGGEHAYALHDLDGFGESGVGLGADRVDFFFGEEPVDQGGDGFGGVASTLVAGEGGVA